MVVLVLVAILVASVLSTRAVFTGSSSSRASVAAGGLQFDLAPAGAAVDTAALRPGDVRTGQVTLTNQGAAGAFTLGFAGLGTGPLQHTLVLTVKRSGQNLYSGQLADVTPIELGNVGPGQAVTLSLTFAWPADAQDESLQGASVPLVLEWSARTA